VWLGCGSGIRVADVFWSFGVAGLELYPCGRCVLEFRCGWVGVVVYVWQMCFGVSVWLGWSCIRVADVFWSFGVAGLG